MLKLFCVFGFLRKSPLVTTKRQSDQRFEIASSGDHWYTRGKVYGLVPTWIYSSVNQKLFPDIEECTPSAPEFINVCNTTTEICQNTFGSFECHCREGYAHTDSQLKCSNINECETGTHCQGAYEECVDLQGTYRCDCVTGFFRVDHQCMGTVLLFSIP